MTRLSSVGKLVLGRAGCRAAGANERRFGKGAGESGSEAGTAAMRDYTHNDGSTNLRLTVNGESLPYMTVTA